MEQERRFVTIVDTEYFGGITPPLTKRFVTSFEHVVCGATGGGAPPSPAWFSSPVP